MSDDSDDSNTSDSFSDSLISEVGEEWPKIRSPK
jgi:hypothetical protein